MVPAFEIASAVRVMFGPALKTLLFAGAVTLTIMSSRLHPCTVAVAPLGGLGVVPRYCGVTVRVPAVVGIQLKVDLYTVVGIPPTKITVACTATSPSTVLPSRKRTVPKLAAEHPCVASHGKLPPAAGATLTLSGRLVPTVIVAGGVTTQVVVVAAAGFTVTLALTELGALGVVPRYCAVTVREPVVVGIQDSEALNCAGTVLKLTVTAAVPRTVAPSRKRTEP